MLECQSALDRDPLLDVSMMSRMRTPGDENRRLKRMFAHLSMQADLLREALGKK